MAKQILYFLFLISAFSLEAQNTDTIKPIIPTATITPKDTAQPLLTPGGTITPTGTVQPQTTVTTTATEGIPPIPTQTIQPVTVTSPTQPNIKHRRKPNETFKKENQELIALYKEPFDKKKEIVLQNKRYRIYNNYVDFGLGKCYNSGWQDLQQVLGMDYNFHVKRNHFQAGFLLAGSGFRDNNCVQLHAGWGYRLERCNYHWAAYGGISYSDGYKLQRGTPQNVDTVYKYSFTAVGGYANVQFYYKLKFDYGIGASAFIDANSKQILTGLRIELFLSGAYKGFKKINYKQEEEKERW